MTKKPPTKKKPPSKRAKALRRDPFGRLGLAVQAYLRTRGWSVVIVGPVRVQQQPHAGKFKYEFVLEFGGGQTPTPEPPDGIMVNAGEIR